MFEPKKFNDLFDAMRGHASGVLSDFEVGSVTRTLTEAFAFEMALLYEKMQLVYLSGFVDTATSSQLDNVVAVLGVQRGLPDFAEGRITFTRDPGGKDIIVPPGTLVATEESPDAPKKVYQTIEELVVPKDQPTGEVRIQAVDRGEQMDTPADTIVVLPRPVPGIKSVANAQEVKLAGKRRETDDELRRRAKNTLLAAGKANKFAIENALIQLPKVRDVKVVEDFGNPDNYGVVDIFIDHPDFKRSEDPVFLDFERVVNDVRAAGILPRIKPSPVTSIAAVFKVKPSKTDLTDKELGELEVKLAAAVRSYIASIPINEPLSISKMVKQLLVTEGVDSLENYRLELTPPNGTTHIKTFSDTTDILPETNGRFVVEETLDLRVVGKVKIVRGEVHFKLPQNTTLPQSIFEAEVKDAKSPPMTIDKASIANFITGKVNAAIDPASMTFFHRPLLQNLDPLVDQAFQIGYAEKTELTLLPFKKQLNIVGAFLIEFPPGVPDQDIEASKNTAKDNLLRYFALLPPATKDQYIRFPDLAEAASKGLSYPVKPAPAADFSTTLDGQPEAGRVFSDKGILLKTDEKASIGVTI